MSHAPKSSEPVDGATATAHVAYQLTDCALIFPITPSSPMTEQYSSWSSAGKKNIFGQVPLVKQMQSEAGSAGALHGATSEGALATTFTSSQGLLLMIPNMYKLAGELMPCVFHIAARTIATEALSIFGDHSDIYAVRSTGFSFLFATTVQEAIHMGIAAHAATLKSRVPFASVQDGFRTTHEIQKIDWPTQEQIVACVDFNAVAEHRARGLNPSHPVQRGTAQNPDVFFQAAVASQPYFEKAAEITQQSLDKVNSVFGTNYKIFEYHGAADATDVVVCMGSAFQVLKSAVDALNKMGAKLGCINVRLYRPFSVSHFAAVVPASCTHMCVLDRGKDVQAAHEPLFTDVCAALRQADRQMKVLIGGVYGLSSKDFNPDMAAAVFDNLVSAKPIDRFSVGILDDVNKTSLPIKVGKLPSHTVLPEGTKQCLLWGIGGDGTIGANKTAIKLIADNTDLHSQGYFAYDANKSGGLTLSHLRFGPKRFEAPYFVSESDYIACHTTAYVNRFNLVASLKQKGIFLLNCPWRTVEELDTNLPPALRRQLAEREAAFYVIDATKIAHEAGLGGYINMVLQAVFFALSGVVDFQKAITVLKESVVKMYHRKGQEVIGKNHKAIDMSCDPAMLYRVPFNREAWMKLEVPTEQPKRKGLLKIQSETLEKFNKEIFEPVARYEGDSIPVSKFGVGGEIPTGTSQLSKRGIADNVPHWHEDKCIQCNQCSFVCPHAVIRSYQVSEEEMQHAPTTLHSIKSRKAGYQFVIQPSDLDCTGCAVCAEQCPVHCLEMTPMEPEFEACKDTIAFVRDQVKPKPELGDKKNVVGMGAQPPYFEFPGSCAGCGETPLVRLVSQLFGDRMVIAAATGCNSIWGGSYPLVPYCTDSKGEGPAWHNSLFEDGAELGYGMISAYRQRRELLISRVQDLLKEQNIKGLTPELRAAFEEWLPVRMDFEKSKVCRDKIKPLLVAAASDASNDVKLRDIGHQQFLDLFARTSFWIIGGDGWAYDIGFGGLDHVVANNEDINILVLDTEVYSNTGGQRSKSTPLGAQAKFATDGKDTAKKDLGRICMQYEQAYVASIAQGADMQQTINALKEAENFPGPSIVIAYTPCTEHHMVRGMKDCMKVQKLAVETGYWINYRFNPLLAAQGKNPFTLDSKPPTKKPIEYLKTQGRYVSMEREFPERSKMFEDMLEKSLGDRFVRYQRMCKLYDPIPAAETTPAPAPVAAAPAAPAPVAK